jgi:hypothetical protein
MTNCVFSGAIRTGGIEFLTPFKIRRNFMIYDFASYSQPERSILYARDSVKPLPA